MVVMNFSTDVVVYATPQNISHATVIKTTERDAVQHSAGSITLQPYCGVILGL